MPVLPTDVASIKTAYTIEKLFAVLGSILLSRQILAGGYDAAKTAIVDGQAYTITSADHCAQLFGYGSQLHRMSIYFFKANGGASPCTAIPLPAASGETAATKTITFATVPTSAGTYYIRAGSYLSEDLITVAVAIDEAVADIAAAVVAAVTAKPNLPFTAANTDGVVTLTAKTKDLTSESLSVTVNQKAEEVELMPGGTTAVVAAGTTGAGTSDLALLAAYMANEANPWNTNIVHPYLDTTNLNLMRDTIGNPNEQTGLYDGLDYRPAHVFSCNTDGESTSLATAIALGDGRKETDCANCRFAAPDYPELGYEIAAYASGFIALNAVLRSSSGYTRLSMPALYGPLDPDNDWTTKGTASVKAYRNVNSAVDAGITPIIYKDGVAKMGDVTTFWHPADNQNAPFKYVVNARKIWNAQNVSNIYLNGSDLLDCPIVNSVAAVKQSEVAIDTDTILAGLAKVVGQMELYGWIYGGKFTIQNMTVTESTENPDRFDIVMPIIVSGNNRINVAEIQVDRNLQAYDLKLTA